MNPQAMDDIPHIHAFNGDADGLCALQQLRLAESAGGGAVELVTGVKRDTRLLERVHPPPGARVTVLDVALAENRPELLRLLEGGCRVRYFDHHAPGEIPPHPALEAHIDTDPNLCTSLLVDRHLGGTARAWAVTGAFGDNLRESAREAARPLGLSADALETLRELGELLNYNAYGDTLADLHFHPADLFRALHPCADPLAFARRSPELERLRRGFTEDLARAEGGTPALDTAEGRVVIWPGEPWARRAQGTFANRLANAAPARASAVGLANGDGTLRISIRAPLQRPCGADVLARRFPTGGGRSGAAGINHLPAAELPRFLEAFRKAFGE
jgi:single-stranded DNA-specific DHH superfamily exonuclease